MVSSRNALVALGSNLGDSQAILSAAVSRLAQLPDTTILKVSRLYATVAVGGPEQPDYLNAAVLLSSRLLPADLLAALHRIEEQHGRSREVFWGPRTLDLDLIDVDGFQSDSAELTVPHPRAHERQFVVQPLCDVAPDWKLRGVAVEQLHRPDADVRVHEDFGWSAE